MLIFTKIATCKAPNFKTMSLHRRIRTSKLWLCDNKNDDDYKGNANCRKRKNQLTFSNEHLPALLKWYTPLDNPCEIACPLSDLPFHRSVNKQERERERSIFHTLPYVYLCTYTGLSKKEVYVCKS